MLNSSVNGKIQGLFKGEFFSSTFQGKFSFQGLFKTVLYIQVLFKPVRTLRKYCIDSKRHTFNVFFVFFLVIKIYSPILPVFFLMIRFQMDRLPLGSTPLVGSSRMTALEPPTKAKATHSLRCIPPDNSLTLLFRQCQRLTSSRILKGVKKIINL